jgi:sec-independent protein translocase protein TatC
VTETPRDAGDGHLPPGPRDQIGFQDLPPQPGHPAAAGASAGAEPEAESPVERITPLPPPPPPPAEEAATAEPDDGEVRMGLLDHLEELRKVLIQCLLAAGAAGALCWSRSGWMLEMIVRPVRDIGVYYTAPNDAFMARFKVAVVAGLLIVAPFVLFRFYGFVMPGLRRRERRIVTPVLVATVLLFYIGVAFSVFIVMPYVMKFMLGFGTDTLKPLFNVNSYLGFVANMCLGFGLVFELPMVILALCTAGIVSPRLLLRTWRYAVVIVAVVSAIFTPPDVISQLMMMVPVLILYWGSVLLAFVVVRRREKASAAAAPEDD